MKLALAQITLGALIVLAAVLDTVNGLPTKFQVSPNSSIYVMWSNEVSTRHLIYAAVFLVLGLAVLGCGTAQLVKARKPLAPPPEV